MQASQFDFSFYDYYSATNSNSTNTNTDTDTASQAYLYQPNGSTNPHASAIPLGHGHDIDPLQAQAQAHAHAQYFAANEHQGVYSSLRMSSPVIPSIPGPPPAATTATTATTTTADPANLFYNTNANTNTNINTNIQYQTATCTLWPSSDNRPSSLVTFDAPATYRPTTGWSYYPQAAPQQLFPPQACAHSPSPSVPQVRVQPATTTPTQPTFASMSRGPFVMPTYHTHTHQQQQQQQHAMGGAFQHPTTSTSAHPIPPYFVLSPVDTPAYGPVFPSPPFAPQVQAQVQAQAHPSNPPLDMNIHTGGPMQAAGATGPHQYDFLSGAGDPFPGTAAADGWSPLSDHSGSSGSPPTTYSTPYSTPLSTAGGHYPPPSAHPGMPDASANAIPRIRRTFADAVALFRTAVLPPHLQHLQHAALAVPGPANLTPNPNPNLNVPPTLHPGPASHAADEGGVIPQMTTGGAGAGAAKRKFKNQKLVADIEARRRNLPRGGPLDALVGRILAADWFRNDEQEPTYSRTSRALGPPALTAALRDGQSIFLAFQDDAQRCVLCAHRDAMPKPNRMVRHIRMHFGLRPFECRLPGCLPCRQGRKRFHSREDLNDHQRVRLHVLCPIDKCRRRLLENNLQRHLMKQHKDIVGASGLQGVSPSDTFDSPAF